MAYAVVADHSTVRDFVWEVCDDANPDGACAHGGQHEDHPHETFTYGADPVNGKKEKWTPEAWKQNCFDGLVALLKARATVDTPAEASGLPELVGAIE